MIEKSSVSLINLLDHKHRSKYDTKNMHKKHTRNECIESPNKDLRVYSYTVLNNTSFVTSEKYHNLNKTSSETSFLYSTSTLFYDLDKIAKGLSYYCLQKKINTVAKSFESKQGNSKKNRLLAKCETIVQECATQMNSISKGQEKNEVDLKISKIYYNNDMLSSDNFLKDSKSEDEESYGYEKYDHHQKISSYANYHTEYEISRKEKQIRNKDHYYPTDTPCPCQLFSYDCPCSKNKSLTKLAKSNNTICLLVTDKTTSTLKCSSNNNHNNKSSKQKKSISTSNNENKITNITIFDGNREQSNIFENNNSRPSSNIPQNVPRLKDSSILKSIPEKTIKSYTKQKLIRCPNCKVKVNLDIIGELEEKVTLNVKMLSEHSPEAPSIIKRSTSDYKPPKERSVGNKHSCSHSPPCELVPVCQILPTDIELNNLTYPKQKPVVASKPKSIRITKACRHHPPCTVVPSCQRVNVLKNNCEYIPPCLHRPRCINIPLCVPFSKTHDYTLIDKESSDANSSNFTHSPHCKCMSLQKRYSLNNINNDFRAVQNTCEYLSEYSPRLIQNPRMTSTFSPDQIPISLPNKYYRSTKYCQYDCMDFKYNRGQNLKKNISSDSIIYIRDVGCQFRNKSRNTSSSVINSNGSNALHNSKTKTENYQINYHTHENKYTPPISGEELSMSTVSTRSLDIDENCPAHGKNATRNNNKISFNQRQGDTFTANVTPVIQYCFYDQDYEVSKTNACDLSHEKLIYIKSRKSFIKKKHKNAISIRRRRRARASSRILNAHPNR